MTGPEVSWVQPTTRGHGPGPRSGHTITVLKDTAVIFGGCGVDGEMPQVFNETYLLHITEGFRWEKLAPSGPAPSARWRHTATLLPDGDSVLVFGGLCRGQRFNDAYVFSLKSRSWRHAEIAGTPPHPRSHHTANLVEFDAAADGHAEKKVFVIGGYGGHGASCDFSMDVHALDLDTWAWSKVERIKGPPPKPRAEHTVSLADKLLILAGGRGAATHGSSGHLEDVHVLDLATHEWRTPMEFADHEGPGGKWPVLPLALWNHVAFSVESIPAPKMFVFGGQKAEFVYSEGVHCLDTGRMVWTSPAVAGAPPVAREDCGVGYDPVTCNLLFFGGWAQGWLADLWCLNVASVVGPAYALAALEPLRGPVTGGTRLRISGSGFWDAAQIRVKFSDGTTEETVAAAYVSPTLLSCVTPSFEQHGPREVVARVAFLEGNYTVNRTVFAFFVNTKADKSLAVGSATLPTGYHGRNLFMYVRTKDSTGKDRITGGDELRVEIAGPEGVVLSTGGGGVEVEDQGDGSYQVCYALPLVGDYQTTVSIAEAPNSLSTESGDDYVPIRGSPYAMSVLESWRDVAVAGAPPAAKDRVRMWPAAEGSLVFVVPETAIMGVDDDSEDEDEDEAARHAAAAPKAQAAAGGHAAAGEEEDDTAGGGSESAAPAGAAETAATAGGDTAGADEEAARAEAAEGKEDEGSRSVAGSGVSAVRRNRKKKRPSRPPRAKPTEVYVLDLAERKWSVSADVEAAFADKSAGEEALRSQMKKISIPDAFVERVLDDSRTVRDWSVAGVAALHHASDVPTPRRNFGAAVLGSKLYVYGGEGLRGTLLDDLYRLDMRSLTWARLFAGQTKLKGAGAGPWRGAVVGSEVVCVSASGAGVLDIVQSIDIKALEAEEADALTAMRDNLHERAARVTRRVYDVGAGMDASLLEGDFETLRMVMSALSEVKNHAAEIELEMDSLVELGSFLEEAAREPSVAEAKAALLELTGVWLATKQKLAAVRLASKGPMERETNRIADEVKAFEDGVEAFRERFLADAVLTPDAAARNPYEALDRLNAEQQATEQGARELRELTELFEFPEIMETIDELTRACRTDLALAKKLWDTTYVVQTQLADWEATRWAKFDMEPVETELQLLLKAFRAAEPRAKQLSIYAWLAERLDHFATALPCVAELKLPCMRVRHWGQLMAATGETFEVSADMTLQRLLKLQLHRFVDKVGEVVDRALKEHSMELTIDKLKATWAAIEFLFDEHTPGSGVQLLRLREEDTEALAENQLVMQSMMASKYLDIFRPEITKWSKALHDVAEVVAQVGEVQHKWVRLEPLFIGSEEVKQELPEPSYRFAVVDNLFRMTAAEMHAKRNAVAACTVLGLRERLAMIEEGLQVCEVALAEFLERKRRAFPRFYFVSTQMLLEMLSNGNRPWAVAQHISSVLQGVQALRLTGDPKSTVRGIASAEGEEVAFGCTGPLPLVGKVEAYLAELIGAVQRELRAQTELVVRDAATRRRDEWLFDHAAQLVLLCAALFWTRDTEVALDALERGAKNALAECSAQQADALAELVRLVQGELEPLQRRKVMSLITMEMHARDVNLGLVAEGGHVRGSFRWASQLRTERRASDGGAEPPPIWNSMCDASFRYGFEYLGNAPRLIVTPLTERVYVTATQAAHLTLGCAPTGPSGTGKTETAKELAHAMGKLMYVFSCGPEMDYRTLGDLFKGLAASGAWGCLDDFGRLPPQVLSVCSVQLKALIDGMRARAVSFAHEGVDHSLHADATLPFFTLTPNGVGRVELPESLKVLLRPVPLVVADLVLIVEAMLAAEGYLKARELASKMHTFYKLLASLALPRAHYDWGLRAIKAVLVHAGEFKRAEPEQPEAGLIMRALRDFNLPKMANEDLVVLMGVLADLFPDVFNAMPHRRDHAFEALVARAATEAKLKPQDYFVQNVVDLQDLLGVRHCVFLMGSPGCNKSAAWRTLAAAWGLGARGATTFRDLNPKAVTTRELYGYVSAATREWHDGILPALMREFAGAADARPKWVVLDGDVDDGWIEGMHSVMDETRVMTLPSNERISMPPNMRLLFEIRDLAHASPSSVTRAGILYISDQGQWKNFVQSWVDARAELEPANMASHVRNTRRAKLLALFDKYLLPTLTQLRRHHKTVVPVTDLALVQTLCYFLEALLAPAHVGTRDASFFELYFVLATVWACGSALAAVGAVDHRAKFSLWWQETWTAVRFPEGGGVFDFYIGKRKQDFVSWSERVQAVEFDPATTAVTSVMVPTGETVSTAFWMEQLLVHGHHAMLVGAIGCGKRATALGKIRSLPAEYTHAATQVTYRTTAGTLQKFLEAQLEKAAGKTDYAPPRGKKLVYFVEDLNMAALDQYDSASHAALLRQHMEYGHIYDLARLSQKALLNTQYVATMSLESGAFTVDPRLQRLFATFAVAFPSRSSLTTIYSTILSGHLRAFSSTIQELGKRLVQAALSLHAAVAATFRKAAALSAYEFTLHHISAVVQGMLMSRPEQFADPLKFVQLWLHESERAYHDRLLTPADQRRYGHLAAEQAKKHFKDLPTSALFLSPCLFCHFANGLAPDERAYDRVFSFADLQGVVGGALSAYNAAHPAMDLVLFDDAMRHVCRIVRILAMPNASLMLVGLGGAGKRSLSRLAAHIAGYLTLEARPDATAADGGAADLKAALQRGCREAGLRAEGVAFLFHPDDALASLALQDVSRGGDAAGLFAPEEKDELMSLMRPLAKRAGVADASAELWAFFTGRVAAHLHFLFLVSPAAAFGRCMPSLLARTQINVIHGWPEEALAAVAQKLLVDTDLGDEDSKLAIVKFLPFSYLAVADLSAEVAANERRFNHVTPKAFLELVALYRALLERQRASLKALLARYSRGVEKLESAAEQVRTLEDEIADKKGRVEHKALQCAKLWPMLGAERERVAGEGAKADEVEVEVVAHQAELEELKAVVAEESEAARPALEAALRALATLNKRDVMDLKGMGSAPPGVEDVTTACMYLLHDAGRVGKVDTSWRQAQFMMRDASGFLKTLNGIRDKVEAGDVPAKNFDNLRPLLAKEHFNLAAMSLKSAAAGGLCEFVRNMTTYYDATTVLAPKKKALVETQRALSEALATKQAALSAKEEAEAKLAELTAQHDKAAAERVSGAAEAVACETRHALATRLTAALGSETARWTATVGDLRARLQALPGDALLAASFAAYAGFFTRHYREKLMSSYLLPFVRGELHESAGCVPVSAGADPLAVLTTPEQRDAWAAENLFQDRASLENGAIVVSSARWPLMVDPQMQGITWIKTREAPHNLRVVRPGPAAELVPLLIEALEQGLPLVLENMGLDYDRVLAPVVGRHLATRAGGARVVRVGAREVEVAPSFRLYLQTRLPNPHYPPETQAEVTLVNFAVTEDGLERQLLKLTVAKERPDLAQQQEALEQERAGRRGELRELEERILASLAEAEGAVLESHELVESLELAKGELDALQQQVAAAGEAAAAVEASRERYREVAGRGALLFTLLSELHLIHSFNHYSLNTFFLVFDFAISAERTRFRFSQGTGNVLLDLMLENALRRPDAQHPSLMVQKINLERVIKANLSEEQLAARLVALRNDVTYQLFHFARRGMLEEHKLALAVRLTLKILEREGALAQAEVDFLLRGAAPSSQLPGHEAATYLSPARFGAAAALAELASAPFGKEGLLAHLEEDVEAWRVWVESAAPEEPGALPGDWEDLVTPLQRLLLLKAFRPDRLPVALAGFVSTALGPRYVLEEPHRLRTTFLFSSPSVPLFFVLIPGVDPGADIERLGALLGFTPANGKFVSLSMGLGKERRAEESIAQMAAAGGWVFLQNVQLMNEWLPRLEVLLHDAGEESHDDFRCFLSAPPPPTHDEQSIPAGLLQASLKVALQPTVHLQSNLRAAVGLFSQETLDACDAPAFHPLLFALCIFHVLTLGRRQFGVRGFASQPSFFQADLQVCAVMLRAHLERGGAVPYEDLRYLFGEILYGGHMRDWFDRRVTNAYLAQMLRPEVADPASYAMLAPELACPRPGDYKALLAHVDALPAETARLYGLHPNSQVGPLKREAQAVFRALRVLGGAGAPSPARSAAAVASKAAEIMSKLPGAFHTAEVKAKAGPLTPYIVAVLQELERANAVLHEMVRALAELKLGLDGGLNISEAMSLLLDDLFADRVPAAWLRICGQSGAGGTRYSLKALPAWIDDLLLRLRQLDGLVQKKLKLPPSLWIGGFWNPRGFVTAVLQVSARAKGQSLDSMHALAEFTVTWPEDLWAQPDEGVHVHGLYMDGARWDVGHQLIVDAEPRELHPEMPVMLIRGVQAAEVPTADVYLCPVYQTAVRGPTHLFDAPLHTDRPADVWVLAAVALLMQPEE